MQKMLSRKELLERYKLLKAEMQKRGLKFSSNTPLDKALFKKAMVGIDVESLDDIVVVKDYVSLGGDFVRSSRKAEAVDVIIKDSEENRDERLEEEISDIIEKETKKKCRFIYSADPSSSYIPLFNKVINVVKETRKVEISKPETIGEYHRIPVRECKITATIDIKDGVKALYCGKEKEIATYLFDVDRFTMKEAKAWVKEHLKEKVAKELKKTSPEEGAEKVIKFKFLKIDKKEHIVGGTIYAPGEEDSQGDSANAEEIWKALKKYMIEKRLIKVMHKGKTKKIPIVECFQPEEDTHKGGSGSEHLVKAGSWWLSVYLGDEPEIFNDVLSGKLTGFSMSGRASST